MANAPIDTIPDTEIPHPATGPADMKLKYHGTDKSSELAAVITGIRTVRGRDLGFILRYDLATNETKIACFSGTDEEPEDVTTGERMVLEVIASDVLPMLQVSTLRMVIGGDHPCTKCGKCGRKFDEDGAEAATVLPSPDSSAN